MAAKTDQVLTSGGRSADEQRVEGSTGAFAARVASWFLIGCGVVTLIGAAVDGPGAAGDANRLGGLAAVGVGATVGLLPWRRWHPRAPAVLAPLGLAGLVAGHLASNDAISLRSPYTYGLFFVVIFAWFGLTQPRWWSVAFAPVAAVGYVLPLLDHYDGGAQASSVIFVIPVGVLVGESQAWAMARVRRAGALDARRVGDLQALLGAAADLSSERDVAAAGTRVAAMACTLMDADAAVLVIPGADGARSVLGRASRSDSTAAPDLEGDPAVDEVIRTRSTFVRLGAGDVVVVPLAHEDQLLGVVVVGAPAREIDAFARSVLQLFGTSAGGTLDRLRVLESLADEALRDSLTGLGNRRAAERLLTSLVPGDGVALLDLDNFKEVNDRAGHPAGDLVLRRLGEFLTDAVGPGDGVARYGGEEFLVVLRGPLPAFERVTRLVGDWGADRPLATLSAGVAVHQRGATPEATFDRADEALYAAKRAGRDRACEAAPASV